MLYGVDFNEENTLERYGLILLADVEIEAPERKEVLVDIPGADSVLDLSNYPLGHANYNNIIVAFNLFKPVDDIALRAIKTTLMNKYHGKRVKVTMPEDTTHYYYGVVQFGETGDYNSGIIPCEVQADPWRYKQDVTVESATLSSEPQVITLENEAKVVTPTVTVEEEAQLTLNGNTFTLSAGNHKVIGMELQPGINEVTATGSGSIVIEYQEASL